MEDQSLLSEAKFQRYKKGIIVASAIILVIGIIAGGCLITFGAINTSKAGSTYETTMQQIQQEYDNTMAKADSLYGEGIVSEVDNDSAEMDSSTASDDFSYNFDRVASNMSTVEEMSKRSTIEYDATVTKDNKEFQAFSAKNDAEFAGFAMIGCGVFVIIASLMFSGAMFVFAMRREMLAFTAQQAIPVAQEGMEKMTPTVAKSTGAIAGNAATEITKGIKKGLKGEG